MTAECKCNVALGLANGSGKEPGGIVRDTKWVQRRGCIMQNTNLGMHLDEPMTVAIGCADMRAMLLYNRRRLATYARHSSSDIPWDILHGVSEANECLWYLDGGQMSAENRWAVFEFGHGAP